MTTGTPVISGDGGLVHAGIYDGNRLGWHPACGADTPASWFTVQRPISCPRCLPGSARNILAITDDIAAQLEHASDGTAEDAWALVEDATRRLRALHELRWLP